MGGGTSKIRSPPETAGQVDNLMRQENRKGSVLDLLTNRDGEVKLEPNTVIIPKDNHAAATERAAGENIDTFEEPVTPAGDCPEPAPFRTALATPYERATTTNNAVSNFVSDSRPASVLESDMFSHTAMSLNMDGDDLLFNLLYFGGGDLPNLDSMVSNALEETVALHSENNTPYKLRPAAQSAVDKLHSRPLETLAELDDVECAVCKDELELNCEVIKLPACNHCFHKECLLRWINLQGFCPVCRAPIEDKSPAGDANNEDAKTCIIHDATCLQPYCTTKGDEEKEKEFTIRNRPQSFPIAMDEAARASGSGSGLGEEIKSSGGGGTAEGLYQEMSWEHVATAASESTTAAVAPAACDKRNDTVASRKDTDTGGKDGEDNKHDFDPGDAHTDMRHADSKGSFSFADDKLSRDVRTDNMQDSSSSSSSKKKFDAKNETEELKPSERCSDDKKDDGNNNDYAGVSVTGSSTSTCSSRSNKREEDHVNEDDRVAPAKEEFLHQASFSGPTATATATTNGTSTATTTNGTGAFAAKEVFAASSKAGDDEKVSVHEISKGGSDHDGRKTWQSSSPSLIMKHAVAAETVQSILIAGTTRVISAAKYSQERQLQ